MEEKNVINYIDKNSIDFSLQKIFYGKEIYLICELKEKIKDYLTNTNMKKVKILEIVDITFKSKYKNYYEIYGYLLRVLEENNINSDFILKKLSDDELYLTVYYKNHYSKRKEKINYQGPLKKILKGSINNIYENVINNNEINKDISLSLLLYCYQNINKLKSKNIKNEYKELSKKYNSFEQDYLLLTLARGYLNTKRYKEAERTYQDILTINPQNVKAIDGELLSKNKCITIEELLAKKRISEIPGFKEWESRINALTISSEKTLELTELKKQVTSKKKQDTREAILRIMGVLLLISSIIILIISYVINNKINLILISVTNILYFLSYFLRKSKKKSIIIFRLIIIIIIYLLYFLKNN